MTRQGRAMNRSYAEQFDDLKGTTKLEVLRNAYPKPDPNANAEQPGAYRLPFADYYMLPVERPLLAAKPKTMGEADVERTMLWMFWQRWFGFTLQHVLALFVAPFYFSWRNLLIAEVVRAATACLGINLGYHRLLTHHSFRCSKPLEYFFAFMGAVAAQGGPIEWVSLHRYHHLHTDTPLDPHSPYEGFWWAHFDWILNKKAAVEEPLLDRANVADLTSQPFYVWLEKWWYIMASARIVVTLWFGGMEMLCWTLSVPLFLSYHTTFLVNSASHIWGSRPYATGDLSTNCWWVALLAYGEGWHNNHHAVPSSARHGLEWWQFDPSWLIIRGLQALGLVWDVHLPTEQQLAAKRLPPGSNWADNYSNSTQAKPKLDSAQSAVAPPSLTPRGTHGLHSAANTAKSNGSMDSLTSLEGEGGAPSPCASTGASEASAADPVADLKLLHSKYA